MTTIEKIFAERSTEQWEMMYLSGNPGMGIHMVQVFPHLRWITYMMSSKHCIMPPRTRNWSKYELCRTLPFDSVKNMKHSNWFAISLNPTVTIQTVLENLDRPWEWTSLSSNPNITAEIALLHHYNWHWGALSSRVKWQTVQENLGKPWHWPSLSDNISVTWSYVEQHNVKWCWTTLSGNLSITWLDIWNNPDRAWSVRKLCGRIDIDFTRLPAEPDWKALSGNLALTMQIVRDVPGEWDWFELSRHPMNTLRFILDNPELPWDWSGVCNNPSLTHLEVLSRTDWNYNAMSDNTFEYSTRLRDYHILRMRRLRARNRFAIRGWYRLHLLTKTSRFMAWYCAEGGVGRRVDHARIRHACNYISNTPNQV